MNIATICELDNWVPTHLNRFIHMAKYAMVDADYHLVVPVSAGTSKAKQAAFAIAATRWFKQIKFVPKEIIEGRLMYYDRLRSRLLEILELPELLYADPDIDIIRSVSDAAAIAKDAPFTCTTNPVEVESVRKELNRRGLAAAKVVEPGFIYMRKNMFPEFESLRQSLCMESNCIAPGMVIWSMLADKYKIEFMPPDYNRNLWTPGECVNAKSVHFTGQWKVLRPYVKYIRGNEMSIVTKADWGNTIEFKEEQSNQEVIVI